MSLPLGERIVYDPGNFIYYRYYCFYCGNEAVVYWGA